MIPCIIERTANGERISDVYSRLLKDRIIFIADEIDRDVSSAVIAQMLFLQLEDKNADIKLYIMSPGGSVHAGMAIVDTMQRMEPDVATYCLGEAQSMAAVILAAGEKGKRSALQSSKILLHQPSSGYDFGVAKDIQIFSEELQKTKTMLFERLQKFTGQSVKRIEADCDRDFHMSATEAKAYGIIDQVL